MEPCPAVVAALAQRKVVAPARVVGVAEEQPPGGTAAAREVQQASLTAGFDQFGMFAPGVPACPAVAAHGVQTEAVAAFVVPHVQQQRAVCEFGDRAFVPAALRNGSQLPRAALVVGEEQLRIGFDPAAVFQPFVVGRNDDPPFVGRAAFDDGVARTGGVPGPLRVLDSGGDLFGTAPGSSVVFGAEHENTPRIDARAVFDLPLAVAAAVPRRQHDDPSAAENRGSRIAAGVASVVPDRRDRAPGTPVIFRTAHHEVDVAAVAFVVPARFGEGYQCAVVRADDDRNSESRIARLSFSKDRDRFSDDGGGGRGVADGPAGLSGGGGCSCRFGGQRHAEEHNSPDKASQSLFHANRYVAGLFTVCGVRGRSCRA